MHDVPFRAVGHNVHLRRVKDSGSIILSVGEIHGIDDRVLQVAEVVSMGRMWTEGQYRSLELQVGDLVVYNQARVSDHFRWHEADILVYPGYWVLGVVRDGALVENPHRRQYEKQPI